MQESVLYSSELGAQQVLSVLNGLDEGETTQSNNPFTCESRCVGAISSKVRLRPSGALANESDSELRIRRSDAESDALSQVTMSLSSS